MALICLILAVVGLCTLVAEFFLGIAVTGWQGEKPYVQKSEQPGLYWTIMLVKLILFVAIPSLGSMLI